MKKVSKVLLLILMMAALMFTFSVRVNAAKADEDEWEEVKQEEPAENKKESNKEDSKSTESKDNKTAEEEKKTDNNETTTTGNKAQTATESHPKAGSVDIAVYMVIGVSTIAVIMLAYKKIKEYNY